jgi:hypothetical protein
METNELRIGNLISDGFYIYKVSEISSGIVKGLSTQNGEFFYPDALYSLNEENLEGLPLTEEWLLKFGFDRVGEWIGIDFNPRMGIRFYNGNSAECDITQDDKYIAFKCGFIQYVHQLQNLYFALTGNELEIK